MNKKIRWDILTFIIWCWIAFTIVFSWSLRSELIGSKRAGILGKIAYHTANIPTKIYDYIIILTQEQKQKTQNEFKPLILKNKWPEIDGFRKNGIIPENVYNDRGYLLLSAYSGIEEQSTVKLIRISDQKVIHEWIPNIDILKTMYSNTDFSDRNPFFSHTFFEKNRFRMLSPLLLKDGSLIIHHNLQTPLIKISKSSEIIWTTDFITHHSIEQDINGNLWTPILIYPTVYDTLREKYVDDGIEQIDKNGNVIFQKSVTEILIENGYKALIWGVGPVERDPLHVNDIQPTMSSSKYWEVGDLFISVRNRSTVFLYRPRTNKILWLKTGPWLNQHDVNIVNHSQISVFDNNVYRKDEDDVDSHEIGSNKVYIFDFEKDTVFSPYESILEDLNVLTLTEGRSKIIENGDAFIEETKNGRLLRVSEDTVKWEFTATIDSNHVGLVSWSRYLSYDQIKDILPAFEVQNIGQ